MTTTVVRKILVGVGFFLAKAILNEIQSHYMRGYYDGKKSKPFHPTTRGRGGSYNHNNKTK